MPYSHRKQKIPREYDRRIKLTEADKADIIERYHKGEAIRSIAREYEGVVSRRMIQFVIFPDRKEKAAELFKERRKDGRYYDKDKWRGQIRDHRRYKQKLKNKNLLK